MTIFLLIFIILESMDVSRPAQTQTSMASTKHEDVHKAIVDGPNLKSSVTEGNTLIENQYYYFLSYNITIVYVYKYNIIYIYCI